MKRILFPKTFIRTVPPPSSWERRPLPDLLHGGQHIDEIARLEQWYRELESEEKLQLKQRLRSLSPREFWSAYFELMTSRIARSLGATRIKHAPALHGKHPDLSVAFPSNEKHIWEVAAAFQTSDREADDDKAHALANWLNQNFRHTWSIIVNAEKFLPCGLSVKRARPVIQAWLDQLEHGGPKELVLEPPIISCDLTLTAYASPDRDQPGLIVQGLMGQGGNVTATTRLRDVIRKKIKKYAAVKEGAIPLVIFVYEGDFGHISRNSLEWALWGQLQAILSSNRNEATPAVATGGLFMPGPDGRSQNTRLSAVVYGRKRLHEGKKYVSLYIYHHPAAQNPISDDLFNGFPQCRIHIRETTFDKHWEDGPNEPVHWLLLN